jgi:hypothetical protein
MGSDLHVREYGDGASRHLPVVYLPELSRIAENFDALAAT